MAVLLNLPYSQFFDDNGDPLAGGKIYTYAAGTTTPKATYTDYSEVTQAANPIVLDSNGRAAIWISGSYRIDVKTSADVLILSKDNITAYTTGGDMTKAVYDPANIQQQLIGTTAVQTLTNKTISGGTFTDCKDMGAVLASNFSKTSDTTFATITGFSLPVTSGNTYIIKAMLDCTSNAASGIKVTFGGITASNYRSTSIAWNGTTPTINTNSGALGGAPEYAATAVTATKIFIEGALTANSSGNLNLQFAQNVSGGTASTVNAASFIQLVRVG